MAGSPMAKRKKKSLPNTEALSFEDDLYVYSERGQRPKQNRSDSLAGIIDTLYSEHRFINSLLDNLEEQAQRLKPGKVPDYHLLRDIIDYLVHYPDQYHHPREDLLYAKLLASDPGFKTAQQRLEREHRTLHSYNDELFADLSEAVSGKRVDRPELLRKLERFITGYRHHINYESEKVFPRAKGTLSKRDLHELAQRTRYINDPLFGNKLNRDYQRLARNLQNQIGTFGANLINLEMQGLERLEAMGQKLQALLQDTMTMQIPSWDSWREEQSRQRASKATPSWQARLMNNFTRRLMKPMMRFGSIDSLRRMTAMADERGDRNRPADITLKEIAGKNYDGEWVSIGRKRPKKVILYFPGGAFIIRTATQHRNFVARICREANARALIVHYRLAPEIPFPGGLEDCLAAYHDLLEQGHKPENITVAGDSAGGGLVLSTLLALRDEGTALPCNAIVLSPLADLTYSGDSRRFNKHKDPMLPTHRSSQMHELYIGEALPEDRFISPVFADFDGLPPMLGQVGSTEILLDDTVRAAEQAEKAGVPFYLEIWEQMPHVFPIFAMLPESDAAIERMAEFINTSQLSPLPAAYASYRRAA
jgi:monoterpene epsilon-lactone hydrolase